MVRQQRLDLDLANSNPLLVRKQRKSSLVQLFIWSATAIRSNAR
jgi:hypothetical protein